MAASTSDQGIQSGAHASGLLSPSPAVAWLERVDEDARVAELRARLAASEAECAELLALAEDGRALRALRASVRALPVSWFDKLTEGAGR
ncbi:MAG: hypothetical protein ABSC94_31535 [Polyangiaceae bacterium]|jgi:hypothetical protein